MLMKASSQSLTEQLAGALSPSASAPLLAPARACPRCASARSSTA
jgi:hypothetical protein